jgi:hypothetical protein
MAESGNLSRAGVRADVACDGDYESGHEAGIYATLGPQSGASAYQATRFEARVI